MLNLYYTKITKEFHDKYFDKYLSLLPNNLVKKIIKYNRWQDAQSTLLGYLLISRQLISKDLKKLATIQYNNFGKPYLNNSSFFNVSHSGDYVIFISCKTHKIGIDIERIDNSIVLDELFIQMTKKEKERIENSKEREKDFYVYWTQKESVTKAYGKGLSVPLKSFEVENNRTCIANELYFTKEVLLDDSYICHISSTLNLINVKVSTKEINFLNVLTLS